MRRLGSGWAIFVEASRVPAQNYPRSQFPDRVSALVDVERREQFEEEGAHFESFYYLTFVWMPPAEDASRAEGWLYEGKSREGVDGKELLKSFADRTDRILQLIDGFVPEAYWLDDEETLTYLHACVSTKRHRVRLPEMPMYLDALLADQPLTGGLEPRLGSSSSAHLNRYRLPGHDLSGDFGRAQSLGLSLSLVNSGDHARQDVMQHGCSQKSAGNGSPNASRSPRS